MASATLSRSSAAALRRGGVFTFARPMRIRASSPITSSIRHYSGDSASPVALSYDLHEPPKPLYDSKTNPILFLHGLFGSKKNNRTISKMIARDLGRHVYALDLRNHGDSPHVPRHDYVSMAEDVANFIHENGLQAPTIIGHSMGAKTAMTLALKSPELVKDLIPVDNAPIDAALIGRFGTYIQGMKRIEEAGITKQSDADKILQEYEKSLPIRQFLLTNLYKPDGQDTRKFRVPLSILAKALDHLGDFPYKNPGEVRFEGPALFVRGTESKYVPDEVLPIIGQFFPRFELADIEAGHWVISEKPEEFRQAVMRFLTPKE